MVETAPVGENYNGYPNQSPVAWIKEGQNIKDTSGSSFAWIQQIWSTGVKDLAADADGDKIVDYQTKKDDENNVVEVKYKDSEGNWSSWVNVNQTKTCPGLSE